MPVPIDIREGGIILLPLNPMLLNVKEYKWTTELILGLIKMYNEPLVSPHVL